MGKLQLGGVCMDKNIIDGSYTRYRMPSEKGLEEDLANGNIKKEITSKDNNKSTISESYVIEHNTVK